jgi:hypothetical protein
MAHAPALMQASGTLALAFRRDVLLVSPLVEMVIMRTAQVLDSEYVLVRTCRLPARAARLKHK